MSIVRRDDPVKPFSSLSYQILLVIGWWWFLAYCLAEAFLLIFKKLYFVYPLGIFLSEVTLLIFLSGTETIRNFLGKKGNLTERMLSVVLSLLLTVPVAFSVSYFLWWQTYVLKIDLFFSVLFLVFLALQSLFAISTLITFER